MPDFSGLLQTPTQWVLFFACAVLIGMSKTGIQNIGTFTVPVFALLFGAKNSTGIVLPLLCMADLMAVVYYRKKLHREHVLKPLPWALLGLLIGLAVGHLIPVSGFRLLIGGSILFSLAVMVWMERSTKMDEITASPWFAPFFGFIVGFTTMIGNVAGPIMAVYLLAIRLPKYAFVATGAWFIMILNYLKIPLQLFVWDNITLSGFLLDLTALPFILLGGLIGIRVVDVLPERRFKALMVVLTVASTLALLF